MHGKIGMLVLIERKENGSLTTKCEREIALLIGHIGIFNPRYNLLPQLVRILNRARATRARALTLD